MIILLQKGIYEKVINENLERELKERESELLADTEKIDNEEAPEILSQYISGVVKQALSEAKTESIATQLELANKILCSIGEYGNTVTAPPKQLLAINEMKNNVSALDGKIKVTRPETSLVRSSLFTGSRHEPSMMSELNKEIESADYICFLVSFIKWSGLRFLIESLEKFTARGGKLRVITTTYMGATEIKAINALAKLSNTEIKVSYDTNITRLHAKAYIFYRNTGYTTAYVGSSNLSNAAISSGLEWNLKITAMDQKETIDKITATFESYWNSRDFEIYDGNEVDVKRFKKAISAENKSFDDVFSGFHFDLAPYSYQQEILDKLEAERKGKGNYKNLVVAATGTGKTVISAFDYKRCRQENPDKCRLLFVAHREEILKQSLECFRGVLNDNNFGELLVGNNEAKSFDNLFLSIQSFGSKRLYDIIEPDYYDFIIVDEFHHATANTYRRLLTYFKPKILLGLTATPERMDNGNILEYFNNRIAAEIRLPEAINRKLLCPFQYFGISDSVDLSNLKWSRGGYDKTALSNLYTGNDARVRMIIHKVLEIVSDINKVKGIGFCVSKEHAKYMSDCFNAANIKSMYLTSDSSGEVRNNAKSELVNGNIKFIFVVDLYNEGVDIKEINTVLFLRPTESVTVFLQQLGRGLRLHESKECLTVLDFIGQSNKKYRFDEKFRAIISDSRKSIKEEIETGFSNLPSGCYIKLEKKASEYILENISNSVFNKKSIINRISAFEEDTGLELNLRNFLSYYNITLSDVYKNDLSFARLCVMAGRKENFKEEIEEVMTKALKRVCKIDSVNWINFMLDFMENVDMELNENEMRMLRMMQETIWLKSYEDCGFESIRDGFKIIKNSKVMCAEFIEVLNIAKDNIDFISEKLEVSYETPLEVYSSYTKNQILLALDYMNISSMRQGVAYIKEKDTDVLLVTLNKAEKDYSPTTMYNDYSINERLFHWQSQSTTTSESTTGKRYMNKNRNGYVLLFVREFNKDKYGGTENFTFLGKCSFVSSEGSKPMNVVWKLDKPIPARFINKTNKMVIG